MAQFYVRKSGNDSNAGTSAGAAWLTIGKALGASGIASGDTVYIGPGVYRETTIEVALSGFVTETFIVGDVTGANTGDAPGEVRLTNYLTDDETLFTEQNLLNLSGAYTDLFYLTFENITFFGMSANGTGIYLINCLNPGSEPPSNITFRECCFFLIDIGGGLSASIRYSSAASTPLNWLIDRCLFYHHGGQFDIFLRMGRVDGADYDVNFVIQNCVFSGFVSDASIYVTPTGAGADKPGGVVVYNCTFLGYKEQVFFTGAGMSTSIPCAIYNSFLAGFGYGHLLVANTSGQIIENYNVLHSYAGRNYTNVTQGVDTNIDGSIAPLFYFGQDVLLGLNPRPIGTPALGSPLLGFGNHSSGPDVDIMNRPRPSGLNGDSSMNAVGAYELHDTGTEETSVYDSAPASMKITGPGDHDFEIEVNPLAAVNITVMVRYNGDHGATYKPQVQVIADSIVGVNAETLTMTEASDTWEMLSFSSFTPLAYGIVKLRCISRSSTSNGIAYFDSIAW